MSSIIPKFSFGEKNIYNNSIDNNLISIGKVVSIDDFDDTGKIIVSIKGVDDKLSEEELKKYPAFPLLPKHLQIMPKVGEAVFVLKLNLSDKKYVNRFWIGPIISQSHKLDYDDYYFGAISALPQGQIDLNVSIHNYPDAKGILPNKKDISIQGRYNSDIIFKNNEIIIRAGKHHFANKFKFNNKSIGYIQIKYNFKNKNNNDLSVINIVANKINLLTHNSTQNYKLTDNENLITDEELNKIFETGHPLVYGDLLIEFLKIMKEYLLSHVHPYSNIAPVNYPDITQKFVGFDLNKIISKNIKID